MKATSAICVAFLCVCLVQSSYGRLSVFRQEILGVPGVQGQSYVVVQDGPNGPQQVARLHAVLSTEQLTPSFMAGLFPSPFEWVSKQIDMVHALQSQLTLDSPPDATTPTPFDDNLPMDGMLQRVKCQRMRQAMVDDATAQRLMLDPGMSSSDMHSADGPAEPMSGAGMMDDPVTTLDDIYHPAQAGNTHTTECFDNEGLQVPCDFDDSKSALPGDMPQMWAGEKLEEEAHWDPAEQPSGTSFTQEDGEQAPLLPGATWQMPGDGGEEGEEEEEEGSMWETEEDEDVEGRLEYDDVAMDMTDDMDDVEEEDGEGQQQGAFYRTTRAGDVQDMVGADAEWERDDRHRRGDRGQEDDERNDWYWDSQEGEHFEHPPPPPTWLVVAGALVAVGVAFLALKALRRMHSRCCSGHGWKCCGRGREEFLQAPLLSVDVYGVKVAAMEAAHDNVKGIDTSVALMKGQPAGISR